MNELPPLIEPRIGKRLRGEGGPELTSHELLRSIADIVNKYERAWMICDPGTADYLEMKIIFLDEVWEKYMEMLRSTAKVTDKYKRRVKNGASDAEKAEMLDNLLDYLWFTYRDAFAAKEDGDC
jgi:hypothetical protein